MLACRYFDGSSSRAWPARATADGTTLRIQGEGIDRTVRFDAMQFARATDLGPARIAFAGGGLCEFDDRAAADTLFDGLGHRRGAADRLALRTRNIVAVTAAFVLLVAALYQWGIPWIADAAVAVMPQRWDDALGDHVLETLDQQKFLKPSSLSPERQQRLRAAFDALRWPGDPPRIRKPLQFRKMGVPNAFALPGGTIVVTDEIAELADRVADGAADGASGHDDRAILTVLAHEAGHVAHRDVMRQLTRSTITSALAAWYFGDASNAFAIAAGSIGTMRYSRGAEHEADLYALETMKVNGLSTQPAAELFRRLATWTAPRPKARDADRKIGPVPMPKRIEPPEYLSTHPATDDRIRLFETGHD